MLDEDVTHLRSWILALKVRLQADCQCVLRSECLSWAISECCMQIGKARAASERPPGFVLGESDIKRQPVAHSAVRRLGRIGSRRQHWRAARTETGNLASPSAAGGRARCSDVASS